MTREEKVREALATVKQLMNVAGDDLQKQRTVGVFEDDFERRAGFYSGMMVASILIENALLERDSDDEEG